MSPFLIVICVIALIAVVILLWFADLFAKGGFKRKKREKKEEPTIIQETSAFQPASEPVIPITLEIPDSNLADELSGLIGENEVSFEQQKDRNNSRISKGRIREYYERKWQSSTANTESSFNVIEMMDDSQVQITPEDVKKLMVLKDLFDKR